MAKHTKRLFKWLIPMGLLLLAINIYVQLITTQISDEQTVCLLVQNIEKDNWKSIHYGMSERLKDNKFRLNTHNFSHQYQNSDEQVNPCPLDSRLIVNGWHRDIFSPIGSNGRLQVIGNSYAGHLIRPEFAIGNYFAPKEKAKLIVDYIRQQTDANKIVTIALALGPEELISTGQLSEAIRTELRSTPNLVLQHITYSTDTKFKQYLAMTQLLLDQAHIDFVIGTPTAVEQGSKIVEGRELTASTFISLSLSRQVMTLVEQGKVAAVVNDKPILQGHWIADWVLNSQVKSQPKAEFSMQLLTADSVKLTDESEVFVPYGYRVIYNTGNY